MGGLGRVGGRGRGRVGGEASARASLGRRRRRRSETPGGSDAERLVRGGDGALGARGDGSARVPSRRRDGDARAGRRAHRGGGRRDGRAPSRPVVGRCRFALRVRARADGVRRRAQTPGARARARARAGTRRRREPDRADRGILRRARRDSRGRRTRRGREPDREDRCGRRRKRPPPSASRVRAIRRAVGFVRHDHDRAPRPPARRGVGRGRGRGERAVGGDEGASGRGGFGPARFGLGDFPRDVRRRRDGAVPRGRVRRGVTPRRERVSKGARLGRVGRDERRGRAVGAEGPVRVRSARAGAGRGGQPDC